MNIQITANNLLTCIANIHDIFLEEAENAALFAITRKRKMRNGTLAAVGAIGVAAIILKVVHAKRTLKSA
ncbi:MAG: hypothetical protein FWE90_09635 [Defluviitaleaceae bacterium]|nr:hypothetical protein [Defluviitaleaceae bacterium]